MTYDDYDYDYHNLVEDVDFIDDEDVKCDNLISESSCRNWENYYHHLCEEIIED